MSATDITMSRKSFLATVAVGAGMASAAALPSEAFASETVPSNAWDKEVDTLVIGAGGAAWGALAARQQGDEVLVVEKGGLFGGTTSTSGGGLWIPCNYVMAENGLEDNFDDALEYVHSIAMGKATEEVSVSYLKHGPEFLEWSRDNYGFHWTPLRKGGQYQDYYGIEGYRPTGRSVELDSVASWEAITGEKTSIEELGNRSCPIQFQLLQQVLEREGVEIMLYTTATRLIQDETGAVVGAEITGDDGDLRVKASKVILGAGGFDYDEGMRKSFIRPPLYATMIMHTCTGDGIRMGLEVGADMRNMGGFYGMPFAIPGEFNADLEFGPPYTFNDSGQYRGRPGAIVVNKHGRRFGNKSAAYHVFNRAFEAWDSGTFELTNLPAYIVFDSGYTAHYTLPQASAVGEVPDGIFQADTLEELATLIGVEIDGLVDEVAQFNTNAEQGIDPIWHRGEYRFDVDTSGDYERGLANPVLAPLSTPPFYACAIYPGSLGMAGGLRINENAQVLDMAGVVIPGLYASGCNAEGPFGSGYPGGGGPVGASIVMGYVAGKHRA